MKELEQRIIKDGKHPNDECLLVGSFLNQNININLLKNMAKDVYEHFKGNKITKILTIEASGIAFATQLANEFNCDILFAKKSKSSNLVGEVFSSSVKSFTKNQVFDISINKDYLSCDDYVLIADDFLAKGEALNGLIDLCNQAGSKIVGCAIEIEKSFQGGGKMIRDKGYDVYSLAIVESMNEFEIKFKN